jgi:hypothetical protein
MDFLTDAWLREFVSTHTMLLGAIPVVIYALLRLWATMSPNIQNNLVRDLLMEMFKPKPKPVVEPRVEPEVKL